MKTKIHVQLCKFTKESDPTLLLYNHYLLNKELIWSDAYSYVIYDKRYSFDFLFLFSIQDNVLVNSFEEYNMYEKILEPSTREYYIPKYNWKELKGNEDEDSSTIL